MRRIVFLSIVLCGFAGLVLALQDPEMQQKVAAAKEAAARNQQALHEYSWTSTTEILVKGEVKNTKIESNQYGPDGTVQKTELSEPPEQEQQQSSGRRRGGRVKKKVVAKKTGEMQEEMLSAAALVRGYVPPTPDKQVTLDVTFQSLPDGTSYAATTVLAIPGDEIEVHIENSNYEKLTR